MVRVRTGSVLAEAAGLLIAGTLAGVPVAAGLVAAAVGLAIGRAADPQRHRMVLSVVADLPGLGVAAAAATLVVAATDGAPLVYFALALAGLVLGRTVVLGGTLVLRRTGRATRRVLLVGTGAAGRRLGATLLERPGLGLEPIGCVTAGDGDDADPARARGLPLPLLGPVTAMADVMAETRVDAVVLALPGPADEAETEALAGLLASGAEVYAVPRHLPPLRAHVRHPGEWVDGVPLVRLHRRDLPRPVRVAERCASVLVALVSLAVLALPLLVLGLLVLLETRGVLVTTRRTDERGRPVRVPRFRTRHVRSVARPGTTFAVAVTGRVGPVGSLLRRTRLEALPEIAWTLARRLRRPTGTLVASRLLAPAAALTDEAEVDAGQLAS